MIINILNDKIELKSLTSDGLSKTNNMVIGNLIDSGIDVDYINQTQLKLKRFKNTPALRKHFLK